MRMLNFGREALPKATSLLNAGTNFGFQNQRTIILDSITASISMGFPDPSYAAGFTESFVNLWLVPPGETPQFSPDPLAQYAGPGWAEWAGDFTGNTMIFDPAGVMTEIGNGPPIPGGLFTAIVKANAPEAANIVLSIKTATAIPTGALWVLHIDVQGAARADVEVGLTFGVY